MKITIKQFFTCFFIIFLFTTVSATAQNEELLLIDSLKVANLNETDHENIVDNNNQIAYLFASFNIDSTIFYIETALELAQSVGYQKGIAECYLFFARSYVEMGKHTEAIKCYNQSLELNQALEDSINILQIYRGLSYVYSYSASQFISLDYSIKALNYAELLNDSSSLAVIYNNIATIYKKLENYESAIYYFKKSLEIDKKNGLPRDLAIAYSNMGILKVEHGKLEEAAEDYRILKGLIPDVKSPYLKAYFYISIAGYYNGVEKYDSAHNYISLANTITETNNYQPIKTRLYRRKGEIYFNQKQYKACISALDQCIELSNSMGIAQEFPAIYKMKARANSQLGNFREAFLNSQQAHAFNDSLQNKKIAGSLAEFEKEQKLEIEIEKHNLEKELIAQQAENTTLQLKQKLRLAIILSSLLLLFGIIFIYFFLRLRRSNTTLQNQHTIINQQKSVIEDNFKKLKLNETKLQKLNASKDKLFSIIAHDLRSPFNAILGFSNELIESYENYNDDERKGMISIISASSNSTLSLLENLLNWARSQSDSIRIQKESHVLFSLVQESITPYFGSAELKSLLIQNTIPEDLLIMADKETIKVVISNLFNNAVKFSNINGYVNISHKLKNDTVEICIADSGIGMSPQIMNGLFNIEKNTQRMGTSNEKGTGLGLLLCKEFTQMNNGKIWVESEENNGSKFYFSLPFHEEQTS